MNRMCSKEYNTLYDVRSILLGYMQDCFLRKNNTVQKQILYMFDGVHRYIKDTDQVNKKCAKCNHHRCSTFAQRTDLTIKLNAVETTDHELCIDDLKRIAKRYFQVDEANSQEQAQWQPLPLVLTATHRPKSSGEA